MAEGRSATLLFHLQKRGFNVTGSTPDSEDDGFVTIKLRLPLPWMISFKIKHWLQSSIYLLRNGLWPASFSTLLTVMSGVTMMTVFAEPESWLRSGWLANLLWSVDCFINPIQNRLPVSIRVGYLASFASLLGVFLIVWAERYFLRALLSLGPLFYFHSYSYTKEKPRYISAFVAQIWSFLIRKLSGRRNLTYGFQLSLPYLPVPSINSTTTKFLVSVEPILVPDEFAKVKAMSESFLSREGPRLNQYLKIRSFILNNYVTPWFERYVYLMSRSPLAVNTNYYVMDTMKPSPVKDQVFRAANLAYHFLRFQDLINTETLQPRMLNDTVPLCMAQYQRLFGTTRIPGREVDAIKHTWDSDYIIVVRRGRFYKVNSRRKDGSNLTQAELAHQLRLITEHANLDSASRGSICEEKDLMALTSLPRTKWAEIRDRYFGEGSNRKSLITIEKSAFIVHLVSDSKFSSSPNNSPYGSSNSQTKFFGEEFSLNKRAHFLFHGEGADIWFDKSFNLIVFEDGQAGINAEITFGDAPVVAHMWEYALLNELIDFENCRDASALAGESLRGAPLPMPLRLEFAVTEALSHEIKLARRDAKDSFRDLDLDILGFDIYGKDFIKAHGVSPDAFIQIALLLTTFGEDDRLGLAYESCHTRLFREGRTETIRSVTKEALEFIRYCKLFLKIQPTPSDLKKAKALLLTASKVHKTLCVQSLSGNGIDRHLFALNVAAKGLEIKSEFLDYAHALKWSISSSQHPQMQTKLRNFLPEAVVKDFFCPGGGYAPISDDGYGVAYTLTADRIFFHVTCKKSSSHTSSKKFTKNLKFTLEFFKLMFEA